jgi:hypothetical protein
VEVRPDRPDRWEATIRLFPGENRVVLVVGNPWKQVRLPVRAVRFLRPPVVASVEPIAARGAGVGDVVAVVASPGTLPPQRVTVAGRAMNVKPSAGPVTVCGVALWRVKVEAVPLETDGALPKTVRVSAGNADGDGAAVEVGVIPKAAPPPPPPPQITVTGGPERAVLAAGDNLRTDQPRLGIGVKVKSVAKLTRVELRRTDAVPGQQDQVPGLDAAAAVAVPDGFELTASPEVPLREGVNQFEVVATTADARVTFPFSVSFTPPPIRVEVDAIEEAAGPGGEWKPLPEPAAGAAFGAAGGFVRVRGRVVWSGTGEAARGAGHEVILVANEVRHLPVELALPPAGSREAAFVAPLFLNAAETRVRVEVHARGRAGAVAQQKVADAAAAVRSARPITQQRLHVLVIAPQVREDNRAGLAREVVAAVGGEFPADRPVFHRMTFKHRAFVRATLYAPLVHNVSKPHIVGLLRDVEDEIKKSAATPGPDGWVNDVVLVYYQGRDLTGKDGLLRLHTTRSIGFPGAGGEPFAVRMDELPPTPGVRLPLLNVVDPDGKPLAADPLTAMPLLLRYVWKDQGAVGGFLPIFGEGVTQRSTVGGVVDWVGEKVKANDRSAPSTVSVPPAVRDRPLGGDGP